MTGRRDASGFTLVEMLLVVTILGIIGFALTESVIIGLRTTTATEAQVRGSLDRQRVATYFVPDVQSARRLQPGDSAPAPCQPAGATPLLTLSGIDRGVRKTESYYFVEAPPEEAKLVRRTCELDLLPVASPPLPERQGENVVADHLGNPPPTMACEDTMATCTLTVTDAKAVPFQLSASRRAS